MQAFKCIVVDDEKPAQRILENYLAKIPSIEIFKVCDSAIDALHWLHQEKIDLIFLDINMPELSGLDLLRTLHDPPKVILTTAYSQYALESYEFGVIDYLLKPFSFQRFTKAVSRFLDNGDDPPSGIKKASLPVISDQHIIVRTDSGDQKICLADIRYIQAFGNYIKIQGLEDTILVRETLSNILKKLPESCFTRVHRSYIVQTALITSRRPMSLSIGQTDIPIGNAYRSNLKSVM